MEETRLPDLVCLSHLRWSFVFQRPQHLMTRFGRERRVFFVEEPMPADDGKARMDVHHVSPGVWVAVPRLPPEVTGAEGERVQARLLRELLAANAVREYVLWYWTPMALGLTRNLAPVAVVFDCMDELSLFRDPPPLLLRREAELIRRADVMFTGGMSLYEHKRSRHPNVHGVPSSVDAKHFCAARQPQPDPDDQARISRPRLGFFGVIDERFDVELFQGVARARPGWQLVVLGPTAKIDPSVLPREDNIHWLGPKGYRDLPRYLAGWDVGFMPFARNEATRFISPTKTPEFLAAGLPVVSTSIRDVVTPYGELGLVRIADTVEEVVEAVEELLEGDRSAFLRQADAFLASTSWDLTWLRMKTLLDSACRSASPSSFPEPAVNTA
jgi:glycosyltransferase involved in cell wall biosynthesis